MRIITTSGIDRAQQTVSNQNFQTDVNNQEQEILNIYPGEQFQQILGFGGAITDSAAYVYSKLSDKKQEELIKAYFSDNGLGYSCGRTHIDSCDFSLESYCASEEPDDDALSSFSFERAGKYIFPMLDDIYKAVPELKVVLSPWSPPAYMKTTDSRIRGGSLKEEYRERWARYMCRYATEYRKRGYNIFAMTVQNEPNAVQPWESCIYTPQQERDFLRDILKPELNRSGLGDAVLIVWDHNKERLFDRVDTICSDAAANAAVGGAGYHWYGGDHFDAIRLVKRKYPDKLLIFTEGCIEYSKGSAAEQLLNAQRYAKEILYGIQAGLGMFLDWNLLLDMQGGPNHKQNYCDAPIMADTESNKLQYNMSYHYIGHFSRYIKPGAVCIGTTCYDSKLGFCAVRNPDKSIIGVILNTENKEKSCYVRLHGKLAKVISPANSISTIIIDESGEGFGL